MPSPKSGNAGSAVPPAVPTAAFDADDANPGAVEQIKATQLQTQAGKYGSVQTKPYKPPQTQAEKEKKDREKAAQTYLFRLAAVVPKLPTNEKPIPSFRSHSRK